MKYTFYIIMLIISVSTPAWSVEKADSLIRLVAKESDMTKKAQIYRNIADLYFDNPKESHYLYLLYTTAQKNHDKDMALEALSDLAYSYIYSAKESSDSVYDYMDLIKKEAGPEEENIYLSYIRMKLLDNRLNKGKSEGEAAVKYEQDILKKSEKDNIYIQIERNYIIGSSLLNNKNFDEARIYLENAYKLANTLSGKNGNKYRTTIGWLYANSLTDSATAEKRLATFEEVLKLYKSDYQTHYAKERPFYPILRRYLQCYSSLLIYIDLIPQSKAEYYFKEVEKMSSMVNKPTDKYNCLLAKNNFYLYNRDYKKALVTIDSITELAKILTPLKVQNQIHLKSLVYEEMEDYKNALETNKIYMQMKDSLASKEMQEQVNKLHVEYDVDKLKFEKTSLENENKKILLITLSIILIFTFTVCVYLYYNLKKEKEMKHKLFKLNKKAEESEKQKTAFINSMCHEIRTPLNSIVGFSDIIVDDSIDNESKKEFCELITANTHLLTSLIEHLLMVANLDSSEDMLPRTLTDIKCICQEEYEKAISQGKKSLMFQLEMPEEEVLIHSNYKYLALVIQSLLSNAIKFTTQGTVTLFLSSDKADKRVRIQVTDTGCGIPADKQELVFQRFIKLDEFTQGNGLGLFLSKLIITRLGGSIQVDPSYTDGARFVIDLPDME